MDVSDIEWTQEFSVGVAALDRDHQRLFKYVRELVRAIDDGDGVFVSDIYFKALMDYTKFHFAREEAVMEACNYPDVAAHKALHANLAGKVVKIRRDLLLYPDLSFYESVRDFLIKWLFEHVKNDDLAYRECLHQQEELVTKILNEMGDEPKTSVSDG